ncbi:MAG: hypothetical protein RIC35_24400 [Marinoscillum sp.]
MKSVIMGTLFIIAIFGPLFYFVWLGRARLNKSKRIINRVANQRKLRFTERELWNDRGLAIDPVKRMLIWVDTSTSNYTWNIINLTGISSCTVIHTSDSIQLNIIQTNRAIASETICIFDTKTDDPFEHGFHQLLATRWKDRINQFISTKNSPSLTPRRKAA